MMNFQIAKRTLNLFLILHKNKFKYSEIKKRNEKKIPEEILFVEYLKQQKQVRSTFHKRTFHRAELSRNQMDISKK